jgi:hypothetical protein
MKVQIRRRLARLEAQLSAANEFDVWYQFKSAAMSIVGFHAGNLVAGESLATAFARALEIAPSELKNALGPDRNDGPDVWSMTLEKLNSLVVTRGGRPIVENGSLNLERPRADDDWRSGLEVLDELFDELPEDIRNRHPMLICFADYLL